MANISQPLPKTAREAVEGLDLTGKVFLVTGAYSGLGAATTEALLSAGGIVIVAGRNAKSQQDYVNGLTAFDANLIDGSKTLDLGSLESVRDFANYVKANYSQIDCLVNNAGVMNTPPGTTKDGFEVQMGVNVIGHFLLAKLLADITRRQVWLSSSAHALNGPPPGGHDLVNAPRIDFDAITTIDEVSYDGWKRYQQSKLGNILLAKQFPLEHKHIKAYAVHPGLVTTNLARHTSLWAKLKFVGAILSGRYKAQSPAQGARTQTMVAVQPDEELVLGGYYYNAALSQEAEAAKNMDDAKKLYDYCMEVTQPFMV